MDWYEARDQSTNKTIALARVKKKKNAKRIELCFSQLKEYDCMYLARYVDAVKKNDELWVLIPYRVDRIDCK